LPYDIVKTEENSQKYQFISVLTHGGFFNVIEIDFEVTLKIELTISQENKKISPYDTVTDELLYKKIKRIHLK